MRTALKVVLVGVVAVGGVMAVRSRGHHAAKTDGGEVAVADRLWIDHLPKGPRDPVQVFVMLDDDHLGVFNRSSQWKGEFELFRYRQDGAVVRAEFPQNGAKESIRTKATECDGEDRDFCLELAGSSRGAKQYLSQEGWELRGHLTERQLEAAVTAKLDAVYATVK